MSAPETRNVNGLRPVADAPLIELRKKVKVAPHSGAMFQDQYRKRPVKGYEGQDQAHNVGRQMMNKYETASTATSPFNQREMGLSAIAMHLHSTLPGPELKAGLNRGYSAFADVSGLDKLPERTKLAEDIHERREQVKSNWMDEARHIPPYKRQRMSMPSPPREPMSQGGEYISPVPPQWEDFDTRGTFLDKTVPDQREAVRKVLRPLSEPAWKPKDRAAKELPTPFHGDSIHEAQNAFRLQSEHLGEVGKEATAKYISGSVPSDKEVRVGAEPSSVFYKTATKNIGAGAHEVKPTDTREEIAALPDHTRTVVAHTQADVRTSTATTLFRGGK